MSSGYANGGSCPDWARHPRGGSVDRPQPLGDLSRGIGRTQSLERLDLHSYVGIRLAPGQPLSIKTYQLG